MKVQTQLVTGFSLSSGGGGDPIPGDTFDLTTETPTLEPTVEPVWKITDMTSTTLAQGWGSWEVNLSATLDGGANGDGETDYFIRMWNQAATDDGFDFKPELTSEPTAPEPDIAIYNGFEVVNTTSLDGSDDGSIDGLAVDPSNPNTDIDGRDFLAWQKQVGTVETGGEASWLI